ncbi:hypothetical protein O181_109748 [Austropuccinia psidii MF-1]|uniref:Uncharacterized protein n=1 Tax=Austropuccinia psidii MF-1 TaxID=1389203 RepID=A0A9Q3PQ49_9BASI|nr:hypothetical protein [Austropuccinia psidii MF-1]
MTDACDACRQAHKKCLLVFCPFQPRGQRSSPQDALTRTPLWSTMMKPYPSANGHRDPKQANGNDSGQLDLSPQVLIFPAPLLGHDLMVTSLLNRSKVIIRPMGW